MLVRSLDGYFRRGKRGSKHPGKPLTSHSARILAQLDRSDPIPLSVREPDLAAVEQQLRNYERLRALVDEWVGLSIERARLLRALRNQKSTGKIRAATPLSLGIRRRTAHK